MKIVLIQQGQFLRSKRRTNPFFDPIIEVCQKNGIDWELYLPSVRVETGYPKDHIRDYHRFSFLSKWFWRIVHVLMPWLPVSRVHWLHGLFARPFCRGWRGADLVITIAQTYSDELTAIRPKGRVVDVQHGVIYSRHTGYFSARGLLRKELQRYSNFEFWVYGQGYADCFFKNQENVADLAAGRVSIIGDVFGHDVVKPDVRNLVVISAQFKPEFTRECLLKQTELLRKFLTEFFRLYGNKYTVLIKHHPRFAGIEEMSVLYEEFPNFKETKDAWSDLYAKMMLHVTISSTVVFDAASNGVLSYLIEPPSDEPLLENWFWRDDYKYPFYGMSIAEVMKLAESDESHVFIRKWFEKFYAPFDADNCKKLLCKSSPESQKKEG